MNLKQHLIRQMAFSHATFGPGERTEGVIDHIRKELIEVEEADGKSSEWVDVVILALDGLTRRLAYRNGERRNDPGKVAEIACRMLEGKQTRNEAREWPDWRTAEPGKSIEHINHTSVETGINRALDILKLLLSAHRISGRPWVDNIQSAASHLERALQNDPPKAHSKFLSSF